MSYCRMYEDSDVYIYRHINGYIKCCSCKFEGLDGLTSYVILDTYEEAIEHLEKHIQAGHKVPDYAMQALKEDQKVMINKLADENDET